MRRRARLARIQGLRSAPLTSGVGLTSQLVFNVHVTPNVRRARISACVHRLRAVGDGVAVIVLPVFVFVFVGVVLHAAQKRTTVSDNNATVITLVCITLCIYRNSFVSVRAKSSGYCTTSAPLIMFMPQANASSPDSCGVTSTMTVCPTGSFFRTFNFGKMTSPPQFSASLRKNASFTG